MIDSLLIHCSRYLVVSIASYFLCIYASCVLCDATLCTWFSEFF